MLSIKGTPIPLAHSEKRKIEAVGFGASLGGPQALNAILSKLPKTFPVPIYVVQHISNGFSEGLVSWLQSLTPLQVVIPQDGEIAKKGHVYIFPNNKQIKFFPGNIIRLFEGKGKGLDPSVSNLFKAMSETYQQNCMGIILTGMGKDGVDELLKLKQKGAITIAQSDEDCLMFGMPDEAIKQGAVTHVVKLSDIAPFLILSVPEKKT